MRRLFRRLRTIARTQYRIFMRKTFWPRPVESTVLLAGWTLAVRYASRSSIDFHLPDLNHFLTSTSMQCRFRGGEESLCD
ncbi:hypothetical protein MAPG_05044 [Magnaporthiopsis poae ATCC 64411]|uniref:Uncharacterized protein n=1 Tax=Magnaporthiopsis poae (strain ATCC 64411 / 73-15) TaxID=644358 RepID=A0A0C4DYC6_MAGP6|nr:hypothetical protein MAPG_05044 [Magnaporthiopsis poae ATCC 64411]